MADQPRYMGGQAVVEGVMMRGESTWAVAVRTPEGAIDVEVHEAGESGLALTASGPVDLDVAYELAPADTGSEVRASIRVRSGGGLTGRLLAEATGALLSAGALQNALSRIAREASVSYA